MLRQFLKQFTPAIFIVMALILIFGGIVYAATWEYKYPIIISDTSNVTRTYTPVMLGFGGQNLINAGKISTSGNDTNMQVGTSSIKYMLSTTNCTAVIPNLPSGGKATTDLYTGYSPEQSAFSIITGYNGYVTTTDNASQEISGNGTITLTNAYIDTTAGANKNIFNKYAVTGGILGYVSPTTSGNLTVTNYDGFVGGTYPTIASDNTSGTGAVASFAVTLPTGKTVGDMLVVIINEYKAAVNPTLTPPVTPTFTQLFKTTYQYAGGNAYYTMGVWYKVVDGTEAVSYNWTTDGTIYAYHCFRVNVNTYSGVPVCGTLASYGNATATNPDPPSLTSGFGAVDTLWIACSGSVQIATVAPTSYSGLATIGSVGDYCSFAKRNYTIATENPSVFSANSTCWGTNTIAIKANANSGASVSATSVASGEHDIVVTLTGGNLSLTIDGGAPVTIASGNVTDNSNSWIWGQNNVMPYVDSISIAVNGTETLLYQPNAMISGTTLPDRATGDGSQDGVITWGTNSGISITYGEMTSYASTVASSSDTGGWTMPDSEMPTSWYANSSLTGLPFYDTFLEVATSTGQPIATLYFLAMLGFAFGVFMLIVLFTRSVLLATVAFNIALFIGSSMSIVPGWLPFSILIVQIGIMYLYKQVAY